MPEEEKSAYEVLIFPFGIGFFEEKSVFEPFVVVIFCNFDKKVRK